MINWHQKMTPWYFKHAIFMIYCSSSSPSYDYAAVPEFSTNEIWTRAGFANEIEKYVNVPARNFNGCTLLLVVIMLWIVAVCVCGKYNVALKSQKRKFNEKHKHEQNTSLRKRNELKLLYCLVLMTDLTIMNSFLIKTPSGDDEYTRKCFKLCECFSVKQEKWHVIESYNFLTFTHIIRSTAGKS